MLRCASDKTKSKINAMEEKIFHRQDSVQYIVTVPLFSSEMYKWEPGQSIEDLSTFSFLGTKFSLLIYPNGASAEDFGFLSAFLGNESSQDILVDCEVRVRKSQEGFMTNCQAIKAKANIGAPKLYNQYNDDGYFNCDPEIVCTITAVKKNLQVENISDKSHYELTRDNAREMKDLKVMLTKSLDAQRLQGLNFKELNDRLKAIEETQTTKIVKEAVIREEINKHDIQLQNKIQHGNLIMNKINHNLTKIVNDQEALNHELEEQGYNQQGKLAILINELQRMENLGRQKDGKLEDIINSIKDVDKSLKHIKLKTVVDIVPMPEVFDKSMKDLAKKFEEMNSNVCKVSSLMKNLQAEFRMHFPDELSSFLSEKHQPKDVRDIETDEDE